MKFQPLLYVLISTFVVSLTACPHSAHEEPKTGARKKIFVKGDPKQIVAGATFNPQSPLTEQNILSWENMRMLEFVEFQQQELVNPERPRDILKENETIDATKEKKKAVDTSLVHVSRLNDGNWKMQVLGDRATFELRKDDDGRLQPFQLSLEGVTVPIQVLHWSVAKDATMATLLFQYETPENGREITAIYFESYDGIVKFEKTDAKFVYIRGPGNKIGWSEEERSPLNFQLCSDPSLMPMVQNSVDKWNAVLKGLKVQLTHTANYAPFSDLNQHCLYLINTYLTEDSTQYSNPGITRTVMGNFHAKIYDADIFIFADELNKIRAAAIRENYNADQILATMNSNYLNAITHELGHALGLGHKFDGTPSIMSYDNNQESPTAYDRDAVNELYPAKN